MISKDKAILKISMSKNAIVLIDKYAKVCKMTKSEVIEQIVCTYIIAQVSKVAKEQKEKK